MNLDETLSQISVRNAIDILLVALLIYQIMAMLRGSRAAQVVLGMLVIVGAYAISSVFDLETINWIISKFYSYLIIVVIVLFQDDIRRLLTRFGSGEFVSEVEARSGLVVIDEVMSAAQKLSHERLGALVVFERAIGLERLYFHSVGLEAVVSEQLLISVFQSFSPLHDGAVIIRRNRIVCAAAHLPLSKNPRLGKKLGTRHSAAVGISEQTDAVVLVVSEETGGISIAVDGELLRQPSVDVARARLAELLLPKRNPSAFQRFLEGNVLAGVNIILLTLRRGVRGKQRYSGPERRQGGRRSAYSTDMNSSYPHGPEGSSNEGLVFDMRFPGAAPEIAVVDSSRVAQPVSISAMSKSDDAGRGGGSFGRDDDQEEETVISSVEDLEAEEESRPSALEQSLAAAALDEEHGRLFLAPEHPTPPPREVSLATSMVMEPEPEQSKKEKDEDGKPPQEDAK